MERFHNPVWEGYRAAVEELLEPLGFTLATETNHYSLFGSASTEYVRSNMRIELFWDGRENWLDLKYATRERNERQYWSPMQAIEVAPPPTNPRAHVLRPGTVADEYLANVLDAIRGVTSLPEP